MKVTIALSILVAAIVLFLLLRRVHRRHAAVRRLCDERGWTVSREGDTTVMMPNDGSWILRATNSFAAQQHGGTTRIVTSTWSSESPRAQHGALIAGPTPPQPLRELAVQFIGSISPAGKIGGWLGLAHVGGGASLRHIPSADSRLLVFGTDGASQFSSLEGVANAVELWTGNYSSEREQSAVSFDQHGVQVRVRVNVLRSADQLAAFVALGIRCANSLDKDFG